MNVITLTLNSTLDKSAKVDGIVPNNKLKCYSIEYQPGGGGINVSRVLKRLGINSNCIYPSAGENGAKLTELLLKETIQSHNFLVKSPIRENFSVKDTITGMQYRFGMPGNLLAHEELLEIKKMTEVMLKEGDILVLSGSIPESAPLNYYASLITKLSKNIKVIVDSSGEVLKETLQHPVYLIKPNQRELAILAGKQFLSNKEQEEVAMEIIQSNKAKYAVVSLGERGAFLAHKEGIIYKANPVMPIKSTIGAGDSMVAGLIYGILKDYTPQLMLKWGVACGVAATMCEGTGLAQKTDIDNILQML